MDAGLRETQTSKRASILRNWLALKPIYILHDACSQSLHMVPPQPVHVLQSFYTQRSEEQEEQLSFDCTALILIVQSSCIKSYISSHLINI